MKQNKLVEDIFGDIDTYPEVMSRREALKYLTLSPVAASVIASSTLASSDLEAADVKGKILIVGGGSGAIMALSRLCRAIKNPDITIIAPNDVHLYQPGQVFVGAGVMDVEDLYLDNKNYIDTDEVTWIKDEVAHFDADNNQVTTRKGEKIAYDYLVVATGVQYNYEQIKGLTKEDIGTNGISSVYLSDLEKGTSKGATGTWDWFQDLKASAKEKKPKVIFTHPNTPIKCGGTPQKMLLLAADYLKQDGLNADFQFVASLSELFFLPKIDAALHKAQDRYGFIENKLQHHLKSIDVKNKKAVFIHAWVESVYDEDFDVTENLSKSEQIELDYDFIHIVPPMSPVKALMESTLLGDTGWLDVDKYSLQHKKYKNVFGIGDTCGIPMGKTGGSARHHGPILTQNLIDVMQAKEPSEVFDGYTVCPIKTQYGKIMMAEFNYEGPSTTLPLNFEEPRWMWWAFDLYMLKPMYQYLMLTGRF